MLQSMHVNYKSAILHARSTILHAPPPVFAINVSRPRYLLSTSPIYNIHKVTSSKQLLLSYTCFHTQMIWVIS